MYADKLSPLDELEGGRNRYSGTRGATTMSGRVSLESGISSEVSLEIFALRARLRSRFSRDTSRYIYL